MQMRLFLLLAFLICPHMALAQARIAGPARAVVSLTPTGPTQLAQLAELDSVAEQTHWKEGAIIGGLVGAIAGGVLAYAACEQSETSRCSTVPGIMVGAALLAIPGALIGGQFPKTPSSSRSIAPADLTAVSGRPPSGRSHQ
jgi:hypothetical protein